MKKKIFLHLLFNTILTLNSFSQVNVGEIYNYDYKNNLLQKEILNIISKAAIENSINFNFCTLKYLVLYNDEGSAGMPNCEISYDIYIVIKDGDLNEQNDKLYILKNIYDLNTKSINFKEVDNCIILNFDSSIARRGKNWEKDFNYIYESIKNVYKIDFKKITKIN